MSWNRFLSLIDPVSYKTIWSVEDYRRVRESCSLYNTTDLYAVYRSCGGTMPIRDFYGELRKLFWFDVYECRHGREFMYYMRFVTDVNPSPVPDDVVTVTDPFGEVGQ